SPIDAYGMHFSSSPQSMGLQTSHMPSPTASPWMKPPLVAVVLVASVVPVASLDSAVSVVSPLALLSALELDASLPAEASLALESSELDASAPPSLLPQARINEEPVATKNKRVQSGMPHDIDSRGSEAQNQP